MAGLDGLIPEEEEKISSSLKYIVTWDFILQVMLHCNIHYTAHKPSTFMYTIIYNITVYKDIKVVSL